MAEEQEQALRRRHQPHPPSPPYQSSDPAPIPAPTSAPPPAAAPARPFEPPLVAAVAETTPRDARGDAGGSSREALDPEALPPKRPQRWFYNNDYTDPVNFGFMFPLPDDDGVSPPYVEAFDKPPVISRLADHSSSTFGSSSSLVDRSRSLPENFIPDSGPDVSQYMAVPQEEYTNLGSQYQTFSQPQYNGLNTPLYSSLPDLAQVELPHRYSPHYEVSSSYSPSQVNLHQTAALVQSQNASISPTFDSGTFPDSGQRFYGDNQYASANFHSSEMATPNLVNADYAVSAAPTKRKRDSVHTPPASAASVEISDPSLSPTIAPKRRPPINTAVLYNQDYMENFSTCWRCYKYQESYNGTVICDSCLQVAKFSIWPSASGTRKQNLDSLVLFLLPSQAEDFLRVMPPDMSQCRTWRMIPRQPPSQRFYHNCVDFQDQWTLSKQEAASTGLFGDDYGELADIAQVYQLSLPVPNKSLETSCNVLMATCRMYKCFVAVSNGDPVLQPISVPTLVDTVVEVRSQLRLAFHHLEALALSPSDTRDRQYWFPSFLSAVFLATSAIVFLDILVACPSPYREQIWGMGWHNRIGEMRNGGYGMLLDVLTANTKGVNPLKMDCWIGDNASPFINTTPKSYSSGQANVASESSKNPKGKSTMQSSTGVDGESPARSEGSRADGTSTQARIERERNVLLGAHSPAALRGILALKAWYTRYKHDLDRGEDMFAKDVYDNTTIRPVSGLWRVFEMA